MNNETKHHADGRNDFDFIHGRWKVQNRRLVRRLQGCTEWEEFDAWQEARPVLGGIGNVDRFTARFPNGQPIEGMTLRIFDPRTKLWSIYWADDRGCQLQPPVIGRFEDGIHGKFFGNDVFDGKPIQVVFHWAKTSADTATWEQAFSLDNGQTWEMNWRMVMTRES